MTEQTIGSIAPETLQPSRESSGGAGVSLRFMQMGALAIVPAVAVLHVFELDRFFVPKELVLHLVAALAALFAIGRFGSVSFSRVDRLLLIFLLLSGVSAALAANGWAAFRATAITASSIALFWAARSVREAGRAAALVHALAIGITLVVVSSLLQTYGLTIDIFSENRAPGGTLGNRNFVAHVAAFGWPLLALAALSARTAAGFVTASVAIALATAALVLTRSRGGWLAFAFAAVTLLAAILVAPAVRRHGRTWWRIAGIILLSGAGVAAALLLPNTLEWRDDNPYLESVRRVAEYQEGSGRGRLIQYERSLVMAAKHPLLGVGPGNWPVEYPEHAARRDPSLDDSAAGMTSNPWPSSDWIAFISERGLIAAALLLLALFTLAASAFRQLRVSEDADSALRAVGLLATLVAVIVAGSFDAVLLLALPSFFFWAIAGALWEPPPPSVISWSAGAKRSMMVIVILCCAAGAARSAAQLTAMQIYATRSSRDALMTAAQIDPGNYRLRLRLARSGKGRCEHARAALQLFPSAAAAKSAARGCD